MAIVSTTMTGDAPIKRSLRLQGHRTSVSMENAFWQEFRRLANARNCSINALAAQIDAARDPSVSLASTLRCFILAEIKAGR